MGWPQTAGVDYGAPASGQYGDDLDDILEADELGLEGGLGDPMLDAETDALLMGGGLGDMDLGLDITDSLELFGDTDGDLGLDDDMADLELMGATPGFDPGDPGAPILPANPSTWAGAEVGTPTVAASSLLGFAGWGEGEGEEGGFFPGDGMSESSF